jgi:opacity protein-like surface antigen
VISQKRRRIKAMIKYLLSGLCAFALIGAQAAVSPEARADWYVSGNVGGTFVNDSDLTESGPGISGEGVLEFDTGYGANGALGYGWDNFRLEGEISYREADISSLTVDSITVGSVAITSLGTFDVDGDASSLGLMANAWYDFDTGTKWVPYIGGGVGGAQVTAQIDSIANVSVGFDESDWVFAYQAGAGIGYKITEAATVQLGYRYFGTSDPEFKTGGVTDEVEFQSHNIEVGFRFRFYSRSHIIITTAATRNSGPGFGTAFFVAARILA